MIALLGWYVLAGPGALSIDRAVATGVRASALPLAAPVMAALDRLRRSIAPVWLTLVRGWLALALVTAAGASDWVPAGSMTGVPVPWAFALLLLAGLALQPVLALLTLVFAAQAAMHAGAMFDLYLLVLLTVLAIENGGALGADAFAARWLQARILHDGPRDAVPADWPHVVIIGAGFGGLACAMQLRHLPLRITLIDRHNYHLFQPLLYQVATGALSPADISTPIRSLFHDDRHVTVRLGTVTAIDRAARTVAIGDATLGFDYCVIATGAQHSYFGRDDWADFAPGLKRIDDAVAARNRVLAAFERAEAEPDPARRARLLTFVIIGAGPTGVEMAGAIAELARAGLNDHYRTIDPRDARIVLVQSGDRVLPAFPADLSAAAHHSLTDLGVDVRLGARVTAIDATGVTMGSDHLPAATVLWAAGVIASPAAQWLDAPHDRAGRVIVGPHLDLPDGDGIYVIGDAAASMAWNGAAVPGLAPAAKQAGTHVARVIAARVLGNPPPPTFAYRHRGSLATIGRKAAVADFGAVRLRGALAWWLWGAVHVAFLAGLRNRLAVVLNWVWCYLSFRVSVQLITGPAED
jgi:NADH dehydrogenase/putative oxidoreductase